jgi:peptidyl-prolyl cis-trans isomerase SurA
MRKLVLSCLATGLSIYAAQAQTLFTYGGKPVSKQEFLRVYQKNSTNKQADFSEPALREYLNLYSLFKMKVQEAEILRLDTIQSIDEELDNYRHQLARNYLSDKEVTDKLVREAYDRMKDEIHVAHILVSCAPNASPADSMAAYRKIDSVYKALTKGKADFAATAKALSDDRGTRENGGDIGYWTALQTLYPFENAIYGTPVGKISAPFRTQFGYHVVKILDKRPARGEVEVAHILLATPKSKGEEGVAAAKRRADSVEALLKTGVSFDSLVARYSDDKLTKNEHGVLPAFGTGRMVPAFENAAFALKNPGDVSAPVKTEYGYHIIRLIAKKPLLPFDSMQPSIKRRIDNDARSTIAREQFMANIKKQNGFKEYPAAFDAIAAKLKAIPDTGANANMFSSKEFKYMNDPLFELSGHKYLQSDFMSFAENLTRGRLNGPRTSMLNDLYKLYVDRTLNDFEENRLAQTNPDFKNLMDEYRNGIMIFELMDRNVWGKASKDTVGLKNFYSQNKNKYMWESGFNGSVYRFKDEAALKKGLAVIQKNKGKGRDEELAKALNTESSADQFTYQRGRYEFSRFKEVPASEIKKGVPSKAIRANDGYYVVVMADEVFDQPTPKSLDEARGYAVAEYQDQLEKTWNAELRAKYPVTVDEPVFKSMVK